MSDVTLKLGDCLTLMRELPDGAFDYCVTDPPYGIGESDRKNISRGNRGFGGSKASAPIAAVEYAAFKWDTQKISPEHIREIRRISRHQVIFGGNYYADQLPPSSSWIVWDKINSGDFADCELAWTSHKKAVRQFRYMWNGMLKQLPETRYHPTQKPLALMKWVIENYTDEGATVLDPFAGSGTTLVACAQMGRPCTGYEIDERYFTIAQRRTLAAQSQGIFDLAVSL